MSEKGNVRPSEKEQRRFEIMFNKYFNELVNFAFYQIGDFEQAQEIVQDIFVRVSRNFDSIENNHRRTSVTSCVLKTLTSKNCFCLSRLRCCV